MAVSDWLGSLLSGGASTIVKTVGDTAKQFITTEADRQQFELALKGADLEVKKLAMEAESKYFEDRQSAREMYKTDSSLQKIFAMTFLVGYILLTIVLVLMVFKIAGIDVPAWEVSLISMIFGAMSSKVNTIVDFLFGSSKGSHDKDEKIAALTQKEN